jgi:hypothetical protein
MAEAETKSRRGEPGARSFLRNFFHLGRRSIRNGHGFSTPGFALHGPNCCSSVIERRKIDTTHKH